MNPQDNKQSTTTFLDALESLKTAFLKVFEGFDVKDNTRRLRKMINYGYKGGERVDKTTARGFSWREGKPDPFDISSRIKELIIVKEYPRFIKFKVVINDIYETSFEECVNKGAIACGDVYFRLENAI